LAQLLVCNSCGTVFKKEVAQCFLCGVTFNNETSKNVDFQPFIDEYCLKCKKQPKMLSKAKFVQTRGGCYCTDCLESLVKKVIVTSTHMIEGSKIDKYLGFDSVEIVLGTGAFSEFSADMADIFGSRSSAFEKKLQTAKIAALDKLRFHAFKKGGNAIVALDLDYIEFSGNKIGLVANGTIVSTKKETA
jgi:uncharacterized protein YbjQ (UPF0145 family)